MDNHTLRPRLTRMHVETLRALDTRRVRRTTCRSVKAIPVLLTRLSTWLGGIWVEAGNGVSVDVTAAGLQTCSSRLTEARDGGTLPLTLVCARSGQNRGRLTVGTVDVSVIRLCSQSKPTRSNPHTGRLVVRIGTDTVAGFGGHVPTHVVEPGHHGLPLRVCHGGCVITVAPVAFHGVGPGVFPELLLSVQGTGGGKLQGRYSGEGRSS
jgi:hypothetical protein